MNDLDRCKKDKLKCVGYYLLSPIAALPHHKSQIFITNDHQTLKKTGA